MNTPHTVRKELTSLSTARDGSEAALFPFFDDINWKLEFNSRDLKTHHVAPSVNGMLQTEICLHVTLIRTKSQLKLVLNVKRYAFTAFVIC